MHRSIFVAVVTGAICAVVFLFSLQAYTPTSNSVHGNPVVFPLKARQSRKVTTSIVPLDAKPVPIFLQGNLTYWAEFFTTVAIGTPPRTFILQVDTGSSDVILYGSTCKGCPNGSTRYNPNNSSSASPIHCRDHNFLCDKTLCDGFEQCAFKDDFGGGNKISGLVGWDKFNPAPKAAKTAMISLGAINNVQPPNLTFEPNPIDGLWGLAHKALSGWYGDPAIAIWINENNFYDSFSICLFNDSGIMEVGTNYYSSANKQYQWTPVYQYSSLWAWYVVWLDDFRFNNMSLGLSQSQLNANTVIVDSGTTLIVVPQNVYQAIAKVLLKMCGTNNMPGICGNPPNGSQLLAGDCIQLSNEQLAIFPNLTIYLYEILPLTIYPTDYLWQGAGQPGYYCLGIYQMSDTFPIILGDVFMQRFHVVFDRNEDVVGFGDPSTCPTGS